jgi:hypothetical protein
LAERFTLASDLHFCALSGRCLSSFLLSRQISLAPVACHRLLADDAAVVMPAKPTATGFP